MERELVIFDSYIIRNILPEKTADNVFLKLIKEVKFGTMKMKGGNVPRQICLQVERSDKGVPIYRHPADHHPPMYDWTPTIKSLKQVIEYHSGTDINHILIQKYMSGKDFISDHSDKTLDIKKGTSIINFSLGATRDLILKTKKDNGLPRRSIKIKLPHNSIFILGKKTNMMYTHSIRQDKRLETEKTDDEKLFDGIRISLTCRDIATFYKNGKLYGQGAKLNMNNINNTHDNESNKKELEKLYNAFHTENSNSNFDWNNTYGDGFNILNFDI